MFGARLAEATSNDVIAERVLERVTRRGARLITIRIFRPAEDPRDATVWACTVEFEGLPRRAKTTRTAHGVDQLQALLLAITILEQELKTLRASGHVVHWMGGFGPRFARAPCCPAENKSCHSLGRENTSRKRRELVEATVDSAA